MLHRDHEGIKVVDAGLNVRILIPISSEQPQSGTDGDRCECMGTHR
jgi:hypothetical protein